MRKYLGWFIVAVSGFALAWGMLPSDAGAELRRPPKSGERALQAQQQQQQNIMPSAQFHNAGAVNRGAAMQMNQQQQQLGATVNRSAGGYEQQMHQMQDRGGMGMMPQQQVQMPMPVQQSGQGGGHQDMPPCHQIMMEQQRQQQ